MSESSEARQLAVVAGHKRLQVGTIRPEPEMLVSLDGKPFGVIKSVTPVAVRVDRFNGTGVSRFKDLSRLSVRHTEALKFGYPNSPGSTRHVIRNIRRGSELISA